jgi:serine/threonine-protein kinase
MPPPSLLQRLKERKLVQWALAYLAGAWVIYEAVDTIGDRWGLTDTFFQALFVLLAIGFFITLVLAWYHGERGRQKVSGPELLMVAALLVVAGVAVSTLGREDEDAGQAETPTFVDAEDHRPSIAILPFESNSPNPEDAFFADGIHEEVTTRVSQISALRVIAKSSVDQFRDPTTRPSVPEMAAALDGVDFLLEGGARIAGGSFRITVRLIDGRTAGTTWSETFDGSYSVEESIDAQTEVARRVADLLQVEITPSEDQRIASIPTENQEAYLLYLEALQFFNTPTNRGHYMSLSQAKLEEAIDLDPAFAHALSRLSLAHGQIYTYGFDRTPERLSSQKRAADSALFLQPDLPEAHLAVGYAYRQAGDDQRGLDHYYKALEGLPNSETVVAAIGYVHRTDGDELEVLRAYERVSQLAPLNTTYHYDLGGRSLFLYHRYQEAIVALERALAITPDHENAAWLRGLAYFSLAGDLDTLRAGIERIPGISNEKQVFLRLLERDWRGALASLGPGPDSIIGDWTRITTRSLLSGWIHRAVGEGQAALAAFDSSRTVLETYAEDYPEDDRVFYGLGHAYAGLGLNEEASRSAGRFYDSQRWSSYSGPIRAGLAAEILSASGSADGAIDLLEPLLEGPSFLSANLLRTVWHYDPLRSHPRFQALLEKYSDDVEG